MFSEDLFNVFEQDTTTSSGSIVTRKIKRPSIQSIQPGGDEGDDTVVVKKKQKLNLDSVEGENDESPNERYEYNNQYTQFFNSSMLFK